MKKYRGSPYSIGIQSQRGCRFGCIFCNNRTISGDFSRLRSSKKVADEIELVANEYGVDSFFFADAYFNFPIDYCRRLCREIISRKLNIRWSAEFNPEFLNSKFIDEAIRAGCDSFNFSPEGSTNETMKLLGVSCSLDAVYRSIELAKKTSGVGYGYSFFYDLPSHNGEHVVGLTNLASKLMCTLREKLTYLSITKIRIYPYTKMYEIALKQKKITKANDLIYPIHYESENRLHPSSIVPLIVFKSNDKIRRIFRFLPNYSSKPTSLKTRVSPSCQCNYPTPQKADETPRLDED
jgi:radical SAM superfamily enzyme YgiQ (UPF0313 family)